MERNAFVDNTQRLKGRRKKRKGKISAEGVRGGSSLFV